MSPTIRPAKPTDIPDIVDLIRGLAGHVGLLDQMKASPADLEATLFAEEPKVFCSIAEWNGETAAMALWFYNYSTFLGRHGIYLEDLFVREPYRAHGIGKALLKHLAQRCVSEGLGRFEWVVLEDNVSAIAFYERQGAELHHEPINCRLAGEALKAFAEA